MCNVETDMQSGDSVRATREAAVHPIASIALTMDCLSEAADQMRLAVSEVLSVTMFCNEVKRSLISLIGPELDTPTGSPEPLMDQLYQSAHRNLAATTRAGRQTLAAINGVEEAAFVLCRLGAQLEAQHLQAAVCKSRDDAAAFCAGQPGCGCAPRKDCGPTGEVRN